MKLGVVNKSTTVNRFVLHTLLRNITHLAVILQKTNIKLDILKGGRKVEKSQNYPHLFSRTFDRGAILKAQFSPRQGILFFGNWSLQNFIQEKLINIGFEKFTHTMPNQTRLLVSWQSLKCSDCLLRFMEQ